MTATRRVQTWIVSSCHASNTQIRATFILIMAVIKCPGCGRQFDSNTGLATHKRACKARIRAVASKLLEARKVNLEKKAKSKRRRIGVNEIGTVEEQLDMDKPDNEEEIWIDEATLGVEEAMPTLVSIFKHQIQSSMIQV
jgi:hypothetical protein